MKTLSPRARAAGLIVLALVVAPLSVGAAEEDARLYGTWRDAEGETLVIKKGGVVTVDGQSARWRVARAGVIEYSILGESIEVGYRVTETDLMLTLDGESTRYRRVGTPPTPTPTPPKPQPQPQPTGNPLGGSKPANPLAGKPVDPFVDTFRSDAMTLVLRNSGESQYRGELTFQGATYPVEVKSQGTKLTGSFTANGTAFPLGASLVNRELHLVSGGETYVLKPTEKSASTKPANPLGRPSGGSLPDLDGVFTGPAQPFQHPSGYYSFDMPQGWSVAQQSEDGLVLNPGLTAADTLDAIIMVLHGTLDPEDRNQPVNQILDKRSPELLQTLQQQGIALEPASQKSTKVAVGDVPGAINTWKGSAGAQPVELWAGTVIKRDYYLLVAAIIVTGKGEKFLPGTKRVFSTLKPKPPQINRPLQDALAGRSVAGNSTSESGSFSTIYEFGRDGSVKKTSIVSFSGIGASGGSTESWGKYQVIGNTCYLYFEDGQESGEVVAQRGQVQGIRFGQKLYSLR